MQSAPIPSNEASRLQALLDYKILDTGDESAYDDLTRIASEICRTPIALVSLIDTDRQWFKSRVGLDATETPRDFAFCAHAILQTDTLMVPDTLKDQRFHDNPLVAEAPSIRFYAGTPLITPRGDALGTLCVIDDKPRELDEGQLRALQALGRQVVSQLELRLQADRLERSNRMRDRLLVMLSHDLKSSFHTLIGYGSALEKRIDRFSREDILDTAQRLQSVGRRAHQQLLGMLEWAREQVEEQKSAPELLSAEEMFEQAISLLQDALSEKSVSVEIDVAEGLSPLWASRCLFLSCIQNLLSNALKFSHSGATITLSAAETEQGHRLSVADRGAGMSDKVIAKVYGGGGGHSEVGTAGEVGSGLGTLLVIDFVESSGGKLSVDSELGRGTTVSFTLPKVSA
ncbi:MAG: GAF domain-containing sensor histidine kinase [Cellvibrionaceae bacterium]